jgi:wobble nucleotide-excising tRNase
MLERIAEIQGIGLLHQANGKPHTCQKATLIYADNGRGKSTLATVFRSVSTGDGSLIADRKTLGGSLQPRVVLHFGSGHKVSFDAGAWSERRPEVLVFDADFIERNVHSGGSVSTGHRKNLLEFALGEAAVDARSAVEKATGDAKLVAEKVHTLQAQLSGHHTGLSLPQFEKLPHVAEADVQLIALQKRLNAAGNVATLLAKPVPNALAEPPFDLAGLFAGLETSLENLLADAEQIVKQQAAKLGNLAAEGWLSQGRQFDDSKACPYCAQSTSGNDLIQAYRTHFSAAYGDLKAKVASMHSAVRAATAPGIVEVFAQTVAAAAAQANSWGEHVQTESIGFDAEAARAPLAALQALLLDLCDRKQAAPTESMGGAEKREEAMALWLRALAPMHAANGAIKAANASITAYKGKLETDTFPQLQQQLQHLQACKRRHEAVVVSLLSQLGEARNSASVAEVAKRAARGKLDTLMPATLAKYEKSINELLKTFGASFSINGMGANFRGGAPRSEYGLRLRGKDIALEGGVPSFATALSDGDKRTLAFAFFISSALADPKLATRTVVIDDPMCSLDLNRKHHTRSVLKKLYSKAEQLVVLAHDPYFLRDLREAFRKENSATPIALFQLALAPGDYTNFETLDLDKVCESDYFQHHRLLSEFAAGKGGDMKSVAKAIRPMLEGYLRRRFPGLLLNVPMFGTAVGLIRDAVPPSPLCYAQNLVDALNEINEYAAQFHHDPNPNADSVAIVASELKTFVDHALGVVHRGA